MAEKRVLCKVCLAPVTRQKHYQPTVCEACKKFFTRTCQQIFDDRTELVCTADSKCDVSVTTRHECRKCRFEKCVASGMNSKFLPLMETAVKTEQDSCENNRENLSDLKQANTNKQVQLVHDPVIYNGSVIENVLKTAVKAFTQLHGFEFLPLKRLTETNIDDLQLLELQRSQVLPIMSIGFSYGSHFVGCEGFEGLYLSDVTLLLLSSVAQIIALYNNLPGNGGASFCGLNDSLLTKFLSWFPQIEGSLGNFKKLAEELEKWRPTLVETAILFALLFFNIRSESPGNEKTVQTIRRRLFVAYDLYCNNSASGCSEHVEASGLEKRQRHFARCFKLTLKAGDDGARYAYQLRTVDPQYSYLYQHGISMVSKSA